MANTSGKTLLRIRDVIDKTKIGKTKIYNMIKNNEFPRHVKIGGMSLWIEEEIDIWIEGIMKSSRAA